MSKERRKSISLADQRKILELCERNRIEEVANTLITITLNRANALMAAVKNILLNQLDRDEHRYLEEEEKAGQPVHEFALLLVAYAEAGGNLRQDGDTEDWPEWAIELIHECKEALEQED